MIVLRFGIYSREDIFELANGKCHAFTLLICEGRIFELTNGKCHMITFKYARGRYS